MRPELSQVWEGRVAVLASAEIRTRPHDRDRAGVTVCKQGRSDSNAQPLVLETSALPIELRPFVVFPNVPHPTGCSVCTCCGAAVEGQRRVSVRGLGPLVERKAFLIRFAPLFTAMFTLMARRLTSP